MTTMLHSEVGRGGSGGLLALPAMSLSAEEVGQRIVAARKEKRWSRLDLSTAMDVSPSSIYRWEKGLLPSVHELIRLARVLDQPEDTFTEPPEHRKTLADLHDLLESARGEAEVGRAALIASLSSLDERLSRIEQQLALGAVEGSRAEAHEQPQ